MADADSAHLEYGVRIDGDVIRFEGHGLGQYLLLAERNRGQVVARLVGEWTDVSMAEDDVTDPHPGSGK